MYVNVTRDDEGVHFILLDDNKEIFYISKGFADIDDCEAVIEKIKDYDKTKDQAVKNAIMQLQETELMTNLLQKLENSFNIKSSIQTKE